MRNGELKRKTNETDVQLSLNLDGSGKYSVDTGIGFFDHMLELFSHHSGIDLSVKCKGDLRVDGHHTVEDIGITMGELFKTLIGDKAGIERYGFFILPMDEVLCTVSLDISGRAYYAQDARLVGMCGTFDAELTEEFFRAFVTHAGITMHVILQQSGNLHHEIEAIFKCFAHALKNAVKVSGDAVPSTKGVL